MHDGSVAPYVVKRDAHSISRKNISKNAVKVLYRLQKEGYDAYLVGGGVRDLLLGLEPKDFDIATNAKPEEVKKIFKNSLLIGKRFKLVHVRFRDEVIEVATFRKESFAEQMPTQHSDHGVIIRDNAYGTIQDDVWRRDFTVNALYYNINDFSVIDYTGGIQDLKLGLIRMIGSPTERLKEDPVRMLRAVRLAAKLGFRIEEETAKPFADLAPVLSHISSARLFDETMKMFLSGYGVDTFVGLRRAHLFQILFPQTESALTSAKRGHMVDLFLLRLFTHTDQRLAEGKTINPAYLFAGLLWYPLLHHFYQSKSAGMREMPAFDMAIKQTLQEQLNIIAIPKRFVNVMREIWIMQQYFEKRFGRRPYRVLHQPRFRAGYDFLLLRAEADPDLLPLAQWWTSFYEGDETARKVLLEQVNKRRKKPNA